MGDSRSHSVDAGCLGPLMVVVGGSGGGGGCDHAQSVSVVDEDGGVAGNVAPLGRQHHWLLLLLLSITRSISWITFKKINMW